MKVFPIRYVYLTNVNKVSNRQSVSNFTADDRVQLNELSFGRSAKNAEVLRALFKYGMIDIHSGKPLIDPEWLKKALQKGLFEKPIQTIVKSISPLEDCLHNVEAELFKKIKSQAKINPSLKLSDVIQKLAPLAQIELLKKQRPIFEKLKQLSNIFPKSQKNAFDELMYTTEMQLQNKPIVYKFSKKEFKYQLERIAGDIRRRGLPEEIKTMEKLIHMSESMPYTPSGRNFKRRKPKFNIQKTFNQVYLIRQMNNYFIHSILRNDKSLNDLFLNTKKQVFNIPTIIPFKRKSFIHDLRSIVDSLGDEKTSREFMKVASKLPTAQEELSAFIMKSSRYSSTKIGHDLIYGSVGAIDHLDPYSHGGADSIYNYGFTSNALNTKRGNTILTKWMLENPLTYTGTQKCVDKLIKLYYAGILEKEGLNPEYILAFARKMEKLSPKEKPLKINLGEFSKTLSCL